MHSYIQNKSTGIRQEPQIHQIIHGWNALAPDNSTGIYLQIILLLSTKFHQILTIDRSFLSCPGYTSFFSEGICLLSHPEINRKFHQIKLFKKKFVWTFWTYRL